MSTGISWTDETWNVLAGCTPVSAGCRFCYAAGTALSPRLQKHQNARVRRKYEGVARKAGDGRAVFTGRVNADLTRMGLPLRWGKARRVFVNSMSDLYHEEVGPQVIAAHFAIMAAAPAHLFQVLTKRPDRQRRLLTGPALPSQYMPAAIEEMLDNPEAYGIDHHRLRLEDIAQNGPTSWPLDNVVIGTSVEDQMTADARIPELLATPAVWRFLSMEPLLGPIDLARAVGEHNLGDLDQITIGGESNNRQPQRARPMDLAWVRKIVGDARDAGIACHVKQLGTEYARRGGLTGQATDPAQWPPDLRIQEDLPIPSTPEEETA